MSPASAEAVWSVGYSSIVSSCVLALRIVCVVSVVLVARPMRSADPGGRAGGCIGRAPAESGALMYCGSVVVAPAVSADAIFFIKKSIFSEKKPSETEKLRPFTHWH